MDTKPDSIDVKQLHSSAPHKTLAQDRFYSSERCQGARRMLQELVDNPVYDTKSSRDTDSLNFCERHLDYLSRYPNMELVDYMSNLKLMTRKRTAYKG